MKRNISYLKYLVRHKWFVFVAGTKTGCSLWRLIVHDLSKLLPFEWSAYAHAFYKEDGSSHYAPGHDFDEAWLYHQHRNKHHWQYWLLQEDSGAIKRITMPRKYIKEMVADWFGASKAYEGQYPKSLREWGWFNNNFSEIVVHEKTKEQIMSILNNCFC